MWLSIDRLPVALSYFESIVHLWSALSTVSVCIVFIQISSLLLLCVCVLTDIDAIRRGGSSSINPLLTFPSFYCERSSL